jgi:hypothetical protein
MGFSKTWEAPAAGPQTVAAVSRAKAADALCDRIVFSSI